ncbi:MAG: DDE-type integrase/transposase/recombinase, partial [Bryobacteraceae bacterium]
YLNNIVEQDHRSIKRRVNASLGFHSFDGAQRTIQGYEAMHMIRTPDGHGRLELSRFLSPPPAADHRDAPVNALGYLRVMFAVDDIDETLETLRKRGAQLVGEVVQYKNAYRLCYIRGPEGLLIGLAQELS